MTSDVTFYDELNNYAHDLGEAIEFVVIGSMGWGGDGSAVIPNYAQQPKGVVLPWAVAKQYLTYTWDHSYGAPKCNAITAWTRSHVIFVYQYDGSTDLVSVPRNPVAHDPSMPGG